MLDDIDRAFFQRRLEEERERAACAMNESAAKPHRDLAREYERRLRELH